MAHHLVVSGIVIHGHGVASGQSEKCPYPGGSIRMQKPYFENLGIPMGRYFPGTINVDISPRKLALAAWDYRARQVAWTDLIPPEDFYFSRCQLLHSLGTTESMIYYPSPATKVENFQAPTIIEILSPKIEGLRWGDPVRLHLNPQHCEIT